MAVVVVRVALSFSTGKKLGRDLQNMSPTLSNAVELCLNVHRRPMDYQLISNTNK